MWFLLAGLARAADPVPCDPALAPPSEAMSVAWVSPVRARVGANGSIDVVPTSQLRSWIAGHPGTTVGRMLQHLGERRSASEPHRLYKVTIFDVAAVDLCRPLDGKDSVDQIAGVYACSSGGHPTSMYSGCGYTTDASDGKRALDLYRVEWRDAAAEGFCVLPAQRFVEQTGKR